MSKESRSVTDWLEFFDPPKAAAIYEINCSPSMARLIFTEKSKPEFSVWMISRELTEDSSVVMTEDHVL